jgi:hypothetical protein
MRNFPLQTANAIKAKIDRTVALDSRSFRLESDLAGVMTVPISRQR